MKVLLVTYFFPPSNSVAAHRTGSFARYLPQHGVEVVVVTRHWRNSPTHDWEADNSPQDVVIMERMKVHRLPFRPARQLKISPRIDQATEIAARFIRRDAGDNIAACFLSPALKIIREEKPDVLLTSSGPMGDLELLYQLHKETGIPYVADLRDSWSSSELRSGRIGLLTSLSNKTYRSLFRSWLSKVSLVTTVNEDIAKVVEPLHHADTCVLPNGYDQNLLDAAAPSKSRKFVICCAGTIYPEQDLSLMAAAIRLIAEKLDASQILLQFIGGDEFPGVSTYIRKEFDRVELELTKRIPHADAIAAMKSASILFYPAWKGYRGVTTTKIYEYLACRKHLLILPTDGGVIQALVGKFQAGMCTSEPAEAAAFVLERYQKWKAGDLHDLPFNPGIHSYSREAIAENFAGVLKKHFAKG